jgi:hypothetical protein
VSGQQKSRRPLDRAGAASESAELGWKGTARDAGRVAEDGEAGGVTRRAWGEEDELGFRFGSGPF